MASDTRMHIKLTEERRELMLRSIRAFFLEKLDHDLGDLAAERILDFFVKELGAPVYNQAIRDAHDFMQEKLTDLEGEFYEPEEPYSR